MKKLTFLLIMVLVAAGFAAAQVAQGGTMYVATKTISLKSSTGFFSANNGTLNYGDRVTVLQINGKFVEVRSENPSFTGWTALANMSARQVVSGNTGTFSARETAMAGKGFNQEVENTYKANGRLSYAGIDTVETITANETALKRFLEEGRLAIGERQ